METNARLSTRRTKTMVTLKHNPSHVRRHTLPSQPSKHLIIQFRLNTHDPFTNLAAPKAKPNIPCCKIKPIHWKNLSTIAILLLHHSTFIFTNKTYLARALQHSARKQHNVKHTYVTPSSSLNTNKLSLATNKPISPNKTQAIYIYIIYIYI